MSDNKLLTENTIRRFMKLANTEALSNNFISENQLEDLEEEVEETNEEINEEEEVELEENFEELEEQEAEDEEMELDAEIGDVDMGGMDDAPEPEMGEADMSLTEEEARLLIDLGERLKAAMDEGAEEAPEGEEVEDAGLEAPEAAEEEGEEEEDDPGYGSARAASPMMEEDQEELVNEVLKRVTKRLVAAKLQNRK